MVKAEVVGKKKGSFLHKAKRFLTKLKIATAILLDVIDFLISWIPIVNTLWDFVTFGVLFVILKDKKLAYFALGELVVPGLGALGLIDGFIPAATIITIIDVVKEKYT